MMRTNVVIDDELMRATLEFSGAKTKREAVETAMRQFVQIRAQEQLRELRGTVVWEGDLDDMRTDKVRRGADC